MSLYLETFIDEEDKRESFYKWAHKRASAPMFMPGRNLDEEPEYSIASLFDELSGDEAGELIYTFAPRREKERALSVIDEHIILNGSGEVFLDLVRKLGPDLSGESVKAAVSQHICACSHCLLLIRISQRTLLKKAWLCFSAAEGSPHRSWNPDASTIQRLKQRS